MFSSVGGDVVCALLRGVSTVGGVAGGAGPSLFRGAGPTVALQCDAVDLALEGDERLHLAHCNTARLRSRARRRCHVDAGVGVRTEHCNWVGTDGCDAFLCNSE